MDNNGVNSGTPPPAYGSTDGNPVPPPTTYPGTAPSEPPPKYEAPKEGPYSAPTGYPAGTQPYVHTPGYPPQSAQPFTGQPQPGYGTTVNQTIIIRDVGFGVNPRTLECPNCHSLITTQATYSAGGLTWLASGLICLFGCWLGCCLIPFCVPECQDVEHHCPSCGRHLGTYHRL